MSLDAETLYRLLPAVYRQRDAAPGAGAPLRALLAVIAEQVGLLEDDLEQLYDDQFVETCADWVVPYIGDLIGVRALHGVAPRIASPRAEVANTIGLRRRKGTAAILEELARDVTGWPARVVELFQYLGWSQYMQHVRVDPPRGGTLSLRDNDACERIAAARGAFDQAAHTVDVRRIASGRGRHNIPNIGLFLWRLQPYPVTRGEARKVDVGCYTFNPVGLDAPLFNPPRTEREIAQLAGEREVPGVLRRRPLHDELEARRQSLVDGRAPEPIYFDGEPVFRIFLDGTSTPIPPEEIAICDLSAWRIPAATRDYRRAAERRRATDERIARPIRAAVDPVLGRLSLPGATPPRVEVSYAYGFADDLGGGPYDRTASLAGALDRTPTWQVGVAQEVAPEPGRIFASLRQAVRAWNAQPAGTAGVIALLDSGTYRESLSGETAIAIPAGSRLTIVAAGWPELPVLADGGGRERLVGRIAPTGLRPHLLGDIAVQGRAAAGAEPGELYLNGLLIEGKVEAEAGNLGKLQVDHCTLVPAAGGLAVGAGARAGQDNARMVVALDRCIAGPIVLPDSVATLVIATSIVDRPSAKDGVAIDAPGAAVAIACSTVLGATSARILAATNCIFTGEVRAARRQVGCVRFSFLPWLSRAPRRYRCQPPAAGDEVRVRPSFTSRRYGDPGYGQLGRRCATEIRRGADDESEMGAFHDLHQPQRETNLSVRLDEYLRFGLEAGAIFVD